MKWLGATVAVCASGHSMPGVATLVERSGLITIVTNDTWRQLPKADVLFAANGNWWWKRNPQVSPTPEEFAGERIVCEQWYLPKGLTYCPPRQVGWSGGNSALRACHLAQDRGATRILLFGVDLRDDAVGHWHEPHPSGLSNPKQGTFERQRRAWQQWANSPHPEVLNCNPRSGLTCFPRCTPEEALCEVQC